MAVFAKAFVYLLYPLELSTMVIAGTLVAMGFTLIQRLSISCLHRRKV
jgi:hypothetical protein